MSQKGQSRFDNPYVEEDAETMSAKEAAQVLGIKRTTLYTYVSRGLVRRVPGVDERSKRYLRDDVMRLKTRHEARAGHGAVAAGALRWGQPVLDSALTLIGPDGHCYRGQNAVLLAREGCSLEEVAAILWDVPFEGAWDVPEGMGANASAVFSLLSPESGPLEALMLAVPAMAAQDRARRGASLEVEVVRARRLVMRLSAWCGSERSSERALASLACAGAGGEDERGVASVLAHALGCRGGEDEGVAAAVRALDEALVLCADHELNVSAFTARVAASAGSDLYACCAAALASLSGPRHGGMWRRVVALLEEAELRRVSLEDVAAARLDRGEVVPGFGHMLYPEGDPRTPPMLERAQRLNPKSARVCAMVSLAVWMRDQGAGLPALDFGLVALCEALEVNASSAACVFAVGRSVGWVAHMLEQRASPYLLRPRARYRGQ